MTKKHFSIIALILLAGLALGACSGGIPAGLASEAFAEGFELNDTNEVEFVGEVEAIGADSWTVSGQTLKIVAATEINGDLAVGDQAKVHALISDAGSLTAREIEPVEDDGLQNDDFDLDDDEFAGEIEFVGTVDSMGGSSWTIGGRTVAVTSSTEIKGNLSVGDLAKVHASEVDGVLTAREIEPAEDDDLGDDDFDFDDEIGDEIEFVGIVNSIGGSSWTIGGREVAVTANTEIKGDLAVGDLAKVHASEVDGVLTAREIEPAGDDDLEDDLDDCDSSGPGNDCDDECDSSGPGSGDCDDDCDSSGPGSGDCDDIDDDDDGDLDDDDDDDDDNDSSDDSDDDDDSSDDSDDDDDDDSSEDDN